MYSLDQVPIGNSCVIARVHGQGAVRKRLLDMGFTKKVPVFVRKLAPLGDPIEVTIRGIEVSVRKEDASMIEVI